MPSNFTFVQKTPNTSTGALSQAFASPTAAGNCIVVVVFAAFAGLTVLQGASGDVTDTQGNQYYCLQQGPSLASSIGIYVAFNIPGGANTVHCTVASASAIYGVEINSLILPYYICPGSSQESTTNWSISNQNTAFRATGGTAFTSSEEVFVVWGRDVSGTGFVTVAATGVVRFSANLSATVGVNFSAAAGDDDVGSITSVYNNLITMGGSDVGAGVCIFLNLNNAGVCAGGVSVLPPFITCGSPPNGAVGESYTHTFPSGAGAPPYTFAITVGTLPPGLTLNTSTGVVSGVPTSQGTYPFTIQVTDNATHTAHVACTITIDPVLSLWCGNPPSAIIGQAYSATIPAGGGVPPYTFALTAGTLPDGLTLDAATGVISGVAVGTGVTCQSIIHFDETTHNDQGAAIDNFWESGLVRGPGDLTSMMIRVGGMIIWARGNGTALLVVWSPDHQLSVEPDLYSTQGVVALLSPNPGISYMATFDLSQVENMTLQIGTNAVDEWVELSMLQPLWRDDLYGR